MFTCDSLSVWGEESAHSLTLSQSSSSRDESNRSYGFFCEKTNTFFEFTPEDYESALHRINRKTSNSSRSMREKSLGFFDSSDMMKEDIL